MPLKSSHLRTVSNGSSSQEEPTTIEGALQEAVHERIASSPKPEAIFHASQTCTLGIHDDKFSKLEVLINSKAFPTWNVHPGLHVRIAFVEETSPRQTLRRNNSSKQGSARRRTSTKSKENKKREIYHVLVVEEATPDLLAKFPGLELSISHRIATALGFRNRCQITASMVDVKDYAASHVEITFRDAYLTRADMWRLVVSELAGKSMYKGQKLVFLNSIKAQIKSIYLGGAKRNSAFFGVDTKPIFRSESARYVLFIQMSKEMWDFDTNGTGEIMFHEVINGFLPELFRRWQDGGARHLVSIILFTRMEYERPLITSLETQRRGDNNPNINYDTHRLPYKDFYRVLISDMSSGSWSAILTQLKQDFKTFLRDVSMRMSTPSDSVIFGQEGLAWLPESASVPIISGHPTAACHGNILEAINVASSQFSCDYIDRDLIRTGLSIIIVTPGTGIFEVDYNLLSFTTEILVENGIGIDLVCLSRVPLHSVPLFKFKRPYSEREQKSSQAPLKAVPAGDCLGSSLGSSHSLTARSQSPQHTTEQNSKHHDDEWLYGIPHWIDVSFYTAFPSTELLGGAANIQVPILAQKPFVPRVRMYEIQMMGIMQNEMSNIEIPCMKSPPLLLSSQGKGAGSGFSLGGSLSGSKAPSPKDKCIRPVNSSSSINRNSLQAYSGSPGKQDKMKEFGALLQWMDDHDDAVFKHPSYRKRIEDCKETKHQNRRPVVPEFQIDSAPASSSPAVEDRIEESPSLHLIHKPLSLQKESSASKSSLLSASRPTAPKSKPSRLVSRQISFGLRGFGSQPPKATPVASVTSENAHSDALTKKAGRASKTPRSRTLSTSSKQSGRASDGVQATHPLELSIEGMSIASGSDSDQASRPIAIKPVSRDPSRQRDTHKEETLDHEKVKQLQGHFSVADNDAEDTSSDLRLSTKKAMEPWLTIVNPSKPSETKLYSSAKSGRWHHVYPRALNASHMKWKSLCFPASVPLTTGEFPTHEQLSNEYSKREYKIAPSKDNDMLEESSERWLMRELISARFSHGFQVVISTTIAQSFDLPTVNHFTIFDDANIGCDGSKVFMRRGSSIHQLTAIEDDMVEIKLYSRWSAENLDVGKSSFVYEPAVRTTLCQGYDYRKIQVSPPKDEYDWHRLDTFISGHEEKLSISYPSLLNFWRARFVLIPVEQPSNSRRRGMQNNEDNDEEIRLEGIRKLTQQWQKNRYISPKERRFQSSRKKQDANPLDIIYQTRNPSAIVAAEMNESLSLLETDSSESKPARLLPDSDLYERSNLNLNSLAQDIQGERGVKMMDRRWHWRLHYNCFVGIEFTTWLLNNFRDIDSREEAVEFGNKLMEEGLFVHVEKRHNFRDGNFFFQIASEYRVPRNEAIKNSWFGRSVPSTPMADNQNTLSGVRSRSSTNDSESSGSDPPTPTHKNRVGVALSKSLIYDVDHRHRSYRPELITLHYDRISSADDCYHLRIDWLNVTPKLIEDAIMSWATLAERNGLRLVELPIAEASKISDFHPFRGPYMIKLAKPPPSAQPTTYFDASSLSSTKSTTPLLYHKAILKKFNFVLDLEAATDFPSNVDVEYSWGRPDYQYPQYISREGVLLVQITHEGDFLLLANRLHNNRTAASAREGHRQADKGISLENTNTHQRSPARSSNTPINTGPSSGNTHTHPHPYPAGASAYLASPRSSPFASPVIRASSDVGAGMSQKHDLITPEGLKNELEAFCSDAGRLEKFYQEVLGSTRTPVVGAFTPGVEAIGASDRELEGVPLLHLGDGLGPRRGIGGK